MIAQDIDYRDGPTRLRGFLAYDEGARNRRPGVLVVHEGLGLNEHAMERARMIAALGYVTLAADMFGEVIAYGKTLHGFTNPAADGSILPSALYNERADRRSWAAMQSLFEEAFSA